MTKFTSTGERAGTWDFTPRMQINDYRYAKPDVDIWSTAATYYYLLTGSPPKDTLGAPNPLCVALSTGATPIRRRNPDIPQRLAEVIDFALQETEDKSNVCSATEFRRMIEAAL
jgi:serine/threonine protein kinase